MNLWSPLRTIGRLWLLITLVVALGALTGGGARPSAGGSRTVPARVAGTRHTGWRDLVAERPSHRGASVQAPRQAFQRLTARRATVRRGSRTVQAGLSAALGASGVAPLIALPWRRHAHPRATQPARVTVRASRASRAPPHTI